MKKSISLMSIFLILSILFLGGCGTNNSATPNKDVPASDKKLKVGMVLPGSVNDGGWNALALDSLKTVEKTYGAEVSYVENVPTSDYEESFRSFISQGFNVVIGHGFEFGDIAMKVGKEYPDVKFVITSSDISQAPNVASIQTNNYEGGYVAGILSALATDKNKVSYIGGMSIPSITDAGRGFVKGAKLAKPDIDVIETYTGNFDDAGKAKELMISLVEKGVDVGCNNADHASLGAIEAGINKDIKLVGIINDQNNLAPDNMIASILFSYPEAFKVLFDDIIQDKFEAKFYNFGFKEGALKFIPNDKIIDSGVKDKALEFIERIAAGEIDINK